MDKKQEAPKNYKRPVRVQSFTQYFVECPHCHKWVDICTDSCCEEIQEWKCDECLSAFPLNWN